MSVGAQFEVSEGARVVLDPAETISLKGTSVLIVDEDPAFQLGLKTFLKEYVGFSQTFTARNGREALERLTEEPSISMVTLDYKMPEMDGIEFLQALENQLPRPLGVIMVTGYPSDELEETFRSFDSPKLRAVEFLSKPVEFTELETIIHRAWADLQRAQEASGVPDADAKSSSEPLTVSNDTATIVPVGFRDLMDSRLTIIEEKVDRIGRQTEKLERRVPSRFGRFFFGLLKLLLAIGLFWAAAHLGWLEKAANFVKNPVLKNTAPQEESIDPEEDAPALAPPEDDEVL